MEAAKKVNMDACPAEKENAKFGIEINPEMEKAEVEKATIEEGLAALERRDRMKSLLDVICDKNMSQCDAVTYALGYFEGISDMDAEKVYTAGDVYDLLLALYSASR